MDIDKTKLTLRLPVSLINKTKSLAVETRRSHSGMIQYLLETAINELNDKKDKGGNYPHD